MPDSKTCSKCGAPLKPDSAHGPCPACLFPPTAQPAPDASVVAEPDAKGKFIGRYKLLEKLGDGGFGSVYVAEQWEPVHRLVALKVLKPGMDTRSVVARFELERQALALMDHPNIARVLDAGATEAGRPFFVMELVIGQKLSEFCQCNHLSVRQRLELFVPVCRAVQHAHQKGIIHRDLKPSNVLVTQLEGQPVAKVIDFGIAKATEQGWDEHLGLTSVNQFLGTPTYMSPEQVEFGGRDVDTRSDIYSLGVILYELLAGQPPFDPKELADAGLDEMRRIIREVDPPRPSAAISRNLNPARPPSFRQASREQIAAVRGDLDWIVMKCLEKDRGRRYETANGLATDILRHLAHEPVLARPPSQVYRFQKLVRRHRLVFGAAGVVTAVLVGAVIVSSQLALRARSAEATQQRLRQLADANAAESRQRLIRRYVAEGNRFMEDGRPTLALPWMVEALDLETGDSQRESDERLRIAQALMGAPGVRLQISQQSSVNSVALSPDATFFAAGCDDGIVRVCKLDNGGHSTTNLSMSASIGRIRFSPDGKLLAGLDLAGGARVWDVATGAPRTSLLRAQDLNQDLIANLVQRIKPALSFSPDGKHLLVAWGCNSAQLWDSATGELVRQFTHSNLVYHAAFSPDGQQVVTSSRDGTARIWSVETGLPAGPVLEHEGPVDWAQFSHGGDKLLTVRDRRFVRIWDWRSGHAIGSEMRRRSVLFHASFSRDDQKILTVARSGYANIYEATSGRYLMEFDHDGGLVDAAFHPDSRHIATACHDGNVWFWNLDDDSRRPMVLPEGDQIEEIDFSKDGRFLAVGTRGGIARVWDLNPPIPGMRRFPGHDVLWVEFSPSGDRALALSAAARGDLSIYEVQSGKRISTSHFPPDTISFARFSPDGRRVLAYGRGFAVLVLDTDSGRESIPALAHEQQVRKALWSSDGKFIVTAAEKVRLWDSVNGKTFLSVPGSDSVQAVALSKDDRRLAVAGKDNRLRILETLTTRQVGQVLTLTGDVRTVEFSPDAKALAITEDRGNQGIVELRAVDSGAQLAPPLFHRDVVRSVQFSGDGRLLATACDDHTVRVWNAATGEPVSPWLQHDFEALLAVFSPDNTRLATMARRGSVRLWNARTGEPITVPILYPRNVGDGRVSYSPDGKILLICRGGQEAWLRELRPETASVHELRLLAQVLSCTQFDPAIGAVPLNQTSLQRAWEELRLLRAAP